MLVERRYILRTLNLVVDMVTTGLESVKKQGCQEKYFVVMAVVFKALQLHTCRFTMA
jgi:hypothetical protein